MIFEPKLEPAILHKRYKRFLADVKHSSLGDITVHCPNTGSMKNCWQEGWKVWLQKSDNTKRKYPYTWVLAQNEQNDWIGINTHLANQLVFEALQKNKISEFTDIAKIDQEVKYGQENSRIDILLTHNKLDIHGEPLKTYIEVKSVTLKEDGGRGWFPDAVTTRGQKHIRELIHCAEHGDNAVLFFLVQHTGIKSVEIAEEIDPAYAKILREAISKGVQVVAYGTSINEREIILQNKIDFNLNKY